MYLDGLPIITREGGYGALGMNGSLGYDGLRVCVRGKSYEHSLSAHAPSHLAVRLDRRFAGFRCQVALNDDVPARRSFADFTVIADGRVVAVMPNVAAGDPSREIVADVSEAARLDLVVETNHWEYCHSLWLDPLVTVEALQPHPVVIDALARVEISLDAKKLSAERCIATVVSPGYTHLLDDMLGSLEANGRCSDAMKVVFAVNCDEQCRRIIEKYGATAIECKPLAHMNPALKAVLYSIACVVDAQQYLCLDADTLILGDLRPVFEMIDACPRGSILVCRDAFLGQGNLQRELCTHYAGKSGDLAFLLGRTFNEASYPFAVNDGVFAGSRGAMLALDNLIRNMPNAVAWVDQYPEHGWRNQFIFNLALARMNCGVELDPRYNLQLHMNDAQIIRTSGAIEAQWRGRAARVLHFCGWGRDKYPELRGLFANRQLNGVRKGLESPTASMESGAST
ncbi:MAG TPA: NPCBM/NEW2 domain-containing protein [Blastocatellia bacterium]|nr:NPCBM/NEW2 domain-containing protein [Blastocatellia bacterium]